MKATIFFIFLLLLPTVTAFNCSEYQNTNTCKQIVRMDLTHEEKEHLLEDIDNKYYEKRLPQEMRVDPAEFIIKSRETSFFENHSFKVLYSIVIFILFNHLLIQAVRKYWGVAVNG